MQEKQLQSINKTNQAQSTGAGYYSVALAKSLIVFAAYDKHFGDYLEKRVQKELDTKASGKSEYSGELIQLLLPQTRTQAELRTNWLIRRIQAGTIPGCQEAERELVNFVADKEAPNPKQIVVGIAATSIPGVTLGRISKKVSMSVIVDKDNPPGTDIELAEKTVALSHQILFSSIESAGGDLRQLEPEVGDWFFGEKETRFYQASRQELERIESEVKGLGIPYAVSGKSEGRPVLALSPVVNSAFEREYWQIEAWEK